MTRKKTNGSGTFNRAALLSLLAKRKASDKRVAVEIPEWGQTVYIRKISARQAQDLAEIASNGAELSKNEQTALMFKTCVCDETGEALIETAEDVAAVLELEAKEANDVLNGIVTKIMEINKLGSQETTVKN